jgi:hypothetical protein
MTKFTAKIVGDNFWITSVTFLNSESAHDFEAESKVWMLQPHKIFIIDFSSTLLMNKEFYRVFRAFKLLLDKDQKIIYSVNLKKNIEKQITKDGMSSIFVQIPQKPKMKS